MSFHQRHPDDRLGFIGFRKLDRALDGGVSVCLSSWGVGIKEAKQHRCGQLERLSAQAHLNIWDGDGQGFRISMDLCDQGVRPRPNYSEFVPRRVWSLHRGVADENEPGTERYRFQTGPHGSFRK